MRHTKLWSAVVALLLFAVLKGIAFYWNNDVRWVIAKNGATHSRSQLPFDTSFTFRPSLVPLPDRIEVDEEVRASMNGSGIGPHVSCHRSCRLCEMAVDNSERHVSDTVTAYLSRHVLFGVVTGSFENFFRVDLALCTWLAHVPQENLFVVTDRANTSDGRVGQWIEGSVPSGVKFSKKQVEAKGYTIHWTMAQYRYVNAIQHLAAVAKERGVHTLDGVRWVVVVDDDTFVDVNALVRFFSRHDKKLLAEHKSVAAVRPYYLGDHGWGGAGHYMTYSAAAAFAERGGACVTDNMVKKFYASDVMLKKCLPVIDIQSGSDSLLSHCQANFLRERMLRGDHISAHVKRDVVPPRRLAMWRMRMYYQVFYHRNRTAYDLLLQYGSCAYGSCKLHKCLQDHDDAALRSFQLLSGNGSWIPLM